MRDEIPNQAVMGVPYDAEVCQELAAQATVFAQGYFPKVTGATAGQLRPIYGDGWFGVAWDSPYVWHQESGFEPFTMRSLAGKTIPMWVSDEDGSIRAKNPKAETRVVWDGSTQVRIFRRAAKIGQRKDVWRNSGGEMRKVSVPASYPGAPGRISRRVGSGPVNLSGSRLKATNPGQIARGNVGVRWRHPGLNAGNYIADGLVAAAQQAKIRVNKVKYAHDRGRVGDVLIGSA